MKTLYILIGFTLACVPKGYSQQEDYFRPGRPGSFSTNRNQQAIEHTQDDNLQRFSTTPKSKPYAEGWQAWQPHDKNKHHQQHPQTQPTTTTTEPTITTDSIQIPDKIPKMNPSNPDLPVEPNPPVQTPVSVVPPEPVAQSLTDASITIVVLGRSGSGVSSTIRELIGSLTKCKEPVAEETQKKYVMEYTISNITTSEGNNYKIKFADIPGLVDGNTLEQDAEVLSTLKSYLHADGFPNFFLALSRFDDNRIDGVHSLFVQFLKRVELFQQLFLNSTTENTAFLLTRLMSETKTIQRKPESKINDFKTVIQQYTSFPKPISIVVGENNAVSEHGVRVEEGYYRLPNKQHYPKNVWQALANVSSIFKAEHGSTEIDILTAMMNNRENEMTCDVRMITADWQFYDEDQDDFLFLLQQSSIQVDDNEINAKIQEVFNGFHPELKFKGILQKTALQLRLQNLNITSTQHLPRTHVERANFFQLSQISSGVSAILVKQAFDLKMPEYIPSLSVGYGYDILEDELTTQTPFKSDYLGPNAVGYELPKFMKCRKILSPQLQFFKSYSVNYSDYFQERINYLDFDEKKNINESKFTGKIKEGFNVQPDENDNVVTLSAVMEARTVRCVIDPSFTDLNEEFLQAVESLTAFNQSQKESVNEWENFFDKFGSHIVTQSFGGGSLHGSLVGPSVRNALSSPSSIVDTLNAIIKFKDFPVSNLGSPSYRLYGGDRDPQASQMYELDVKTRDALFKRWTDSLKTDFIMLNYEFKLLPISTFVEKHNPDKADHIATAIDLLLRGELKYVRKPRPSNGTRRQPKLTTKKPNQNKPTRGFNSNHPGQSSTPVSPSTIPSSYDSNYPTLSPSIPIRPENQHNQYSSGQYLPFPTNNTSNLNFPRVQLNPNTVGDSDSQAALMVLQNTNAAVDLLSQNVDDKRKRDEQNFQQKTEFMQKQKEEGERLIRQRHNDTMTNIQLQNNNTNVFYQNTLNAIDQQTALDAERANDHIENIRRDNEERERRHQEFLEGLRRQREEEEKRRHAEWKERCGGYKKVLPTCW